MSDRTRGFYARYGKRAFDLALGIPITVAVAPVAGVVAWKVARELGRPVLFTQLRGGLGCSKFSIYKFRTMADARAADGTLLPDEERISAFGERLRRASLDELPQLINVLRGEMSLVGPRPLIAQYNDLYSPEQRRRLDVKPGMTGWCQVNGRNALDWPSKFALDVHYVDNLSFWMDVKILFATAAVVFRKKGYAPEGETRAEYFRGETESRPSGSAGDATTFPPRGTK